MATEKHHHRSKSQLARSLLSRASSRQEVNKEDTESTDPQGRSSLGESAASESNVSLISTSRSVRHRPHLSTTMSPQATREISNRSSPTVDTSPAADGDVSLQQSIQLFKYFEALRNGDTAAIAKAMKEQNAESPARLQGTTILHLAIQCAEMPIIEFVMSNLSTGEILEGINAKDKEGNTPLHLASKLGRVQVVTVLLDQADINDSITNLRGETALDVAYSPEIFQQLQLARSLFIESNVGRIHSLVASKDYTQLGNLLNDSRIRSSINVNGPELATDKSTLDTSGTLLHEAARKKDVQLIQLLLMNGADPFQRDKKGKLPQDVTKDEKTRHILKRSPAAVAAQRSIQERGIVGNTSTQAGPSSAPADNPLGGKESREMKGYLKKWTNYTGGWKLRWFVLEDGVLSYYKNQDDAGAACRGAINMRIARLSMDAQDKLRFEIQGKSSVKYHLRANHQVEAKRWYWALNNAIQWTKDEDREEQKRLDRQSEALKNAKAEQDKRQARESDTQSLQSIRNRSGTQGQTLAPPAHLQAQASSAGDEEENGLSMYESSVAPATRLTSRTDVDGYDQDEEMGDDASSHEPQPAQKDALNITAQSLKMQLDLLSQVSTSLRDEVTRNPALTFSDPMAVQAMATYESSVGNLRGLIGAYLRLASDRDAYWQYRLEREANMRRLWEDSMAKVAKEQEDLQNRMGEVEDKRKRTKRALRDALENLAETGPESPYMASQEPQLVIPKLDKTAVTAMPEISPMRKKSTVVELAGELSDSDSDQDEEFFDAVDAGEVEVVHLSEAIEKKVELPAAVEGSRERKMAQIQSSFVGYEEPVRARLKLDADNRPKISLWGILRSMIGKDMTRMTLPVTFNEPTSLLQRVAEDMEYTDLLDSAAEMVDSTERLVYVAAFAASEYASTIGRVAKPFNPLLGETYEYVRPDKGYRFFIEQVSHHPPIGAAYAESPRWDYYGESSVQSKFYGRSFDINPLGTWFLRLRPSTGGSELYTWKKVTSSVINIITGNPTVDNYGTMEIKNWTTGEVCILEFKPRGWGKSSAYIVSGRVVDSGGKTRWSMGGRWNDKIYARLTPGYEDVTFDPNTASSSNKLNNRTNSINPAQAFLVWEAHARPTGIPFNLTPFVVTLNAVTDNLRPCLAPTDTRLRPDQRAMEDGEYDFAAVEKNRLEEKQRKRRRQREKDGETFIPRWFSKARCETTGEAYWKFSGDYWTSRDTVAKGTGQWTDLEDIFSMEAVN